MKKILLLFGCLFGLIFQAFSQTDSVPYSREYEFKEGIYLSLENFKRNDPIPKQSIISGVPQGQIDFMSEVMAAKFVRYKDKDGVEQKLETSTAWGYCQNRGIFVNFNKSFNRVNVVGSLCHLVATVVTYGGIQDPMGNNFSINNTYEELKQFVLDTQNNQILDFTVVNMEKLLSVDGALYAEFMKLSKKKKAESIFIYLRKYNEKHPLYLPAN